MNLLRMLGLVALLSVMAGCATVIRGTRQDMTFQTDPPGATVLVDGHKYTSPAVVSLKRKEPHQVVVEAPGYRPIQFTLQSEWDGLTLPEIAAPGGSVMMATDVADGADRRFYTLETIKLQPATQPSTQPLALKPRHGKLMTQQEYDADVAADHANRARFFGMEY